VLRGLHRFHLVRGSHARAREFAEQCVTLGQNVDDSDLMLEGHLALRESSFYMGRLISAQQHLTEAISLYKADKHRPSATRSVQDPSVAFRFHLALTTQLLGYPDRAANINGTNLSLADELAHPFSSAHALTSAAVFYQLRRDRELTREYAEAALEASRSGQFSLFVAEATILLGWALAQQGQTEEGIVRMREGLTAWRATGAELWTPLFLDCSPIVTALVRWKMRPS
jgi:predicted ATPase